MAMFAGGFECPNWWRKGEEKRKTNGKRKDGEKGNEEQRERFRGRDE
jgi:hypothetical protein